MKGIVRIWVVAAALGSASTAQAAGINGVNAGMPNRISMNVTVPKQTQGATFGEKVATGLQSGANALSQGASLSLEIECGQAACVVVLPDGGGYRADLQRRRVEVLKSNRTGDPGANAARSAGQGRSLLGGALPGDSIVSAAVSSIGGMGKPGGMTSSSYARTAQSARPMPVRREGSAIDVLEPLADGDYLLTLVVDNIGSSPTDARRAQARAAAPQRRVKIELGFTVEAGALKTRHDTAKNAISNIR